MRLGSHRKWSIHSPGRCFWLFALLLLFLVPNIGCGTKTSAVDPAPSGAGLQPPSPGAPSSDTTEDPGSTPDDVYNGTDEGWDEDWDEGYEEFYDDPYGDDDGYGESTLPPDPLEPFNRIMFTFNDKLYFWVLEPTASVYSAVLPEQMRTGIYNVFHNLAFPIRFVSSILQLKLDKAAKEVGAFAMNTTFGIGGLVKISDHITPLQDISPEDLGQTLAHYGVGEGIYIVWPVFGPSTLRDTTAQFGEYFLDPINYVDGWKIRWALKGEKTLNYTSLHLGDYEDLKKAAFDPYEALKDFYIQHHRHLVRE
ncbi:MlaA family lipoprotein [Desulfoplanes sp.]